MSATLLSRPPAAPMRAPSDLDAPPLPSLAAHAHWLRRFRPPFVFGDFFAPEDTLLCGLATDWALARTARAARRAPRRLVELTCGGALVALAPLDRWPTLEAWGADVDDAAIARARRNAAALGVGHRTRFRTLGLFDRRIAAWLRRADADVVACNPPYVPEPPDARLALVAGSGTDGADHPKRALAAAARAGVPRLVLSWCSLGDPVGVARAAAARGYVLEKLWAALIADGEYTGAVHEYLRTLPTAFLAEDAATRRAVAPDGSACFGYLLLAASFARPDAPGVESMDPRAGVRLVRRLVTRLARRGIAGLHTRPHDPARGGVPNGRRDGGPPLRLYVADRWDELVLRAEAHGVLG